MTKKRDEIKVKAGKSAAARRGTNGRQEHKGKAPSSNKNVGGKMAK